METNDSNELYKKGSVLMQSALKKYGEGDFEGGEKDREQANHFYDMAKAAMNMESDNIMALYGENRNFGVIYNVFEENAKRIIQEKANPKVISDFVKAIKNDTLLSEQFKFYNALCNETIECDANDYINEAIQILPQFKKKDIIKSNEKLIKILKENQLDELIDIPDEKMDLYESIEFLLLNKRSPKNLEAIVNSKNIIKESLNKCSQRNNEITAITETEYKKELKNLVENYSSTLNDDEMALMEEICVSDKKEVFEKYKNETLNFISEQISSSIELEDKIDWNNIFNKVNLKEYNEKTILEDVVSFINIKNIIEE